ncbi:MAG: 3-hydroxyacyl-[acyl-carrier-protein] dehydratase, partial [Abditibacteriota bacterium]|nr:3-hydroxyacyl-[acyl-carrier-protein] dehydratase [Abditibacteriota bacterium]
MAEQSSQNAAASSNGGATGQPQSAEKGVKNSGANGAAVTNAGERTSTAGASSNNSKVQMSKTPFPALQMPLGYEEICEILPHRYPFLLVDKITELEPGKRCVGVKNVTANEEFFQGHFPGHPVMPGVLILEAMAQVAGVLTLVSRNTPGALSYFAAIEKARFRQPVRPGDQVITEAELQVLRGPYCKVHVTGRVDDQIVVEADYTFMTSSDSAAAAIVSQQTGQPVAGVTPTSAAVPTAPSALVQSAAAVAPVVQTVAASNGNAAANRRTPVVTAPREASGETFIHPTALVDPDADLEEGAWIGPFCIVEGSTRIGRGTVLEANVTIKRGTTIGARCRIWPHVVLGHEPQDM